MPDVAPLPARANGWVTFGYFGRTVRLNDAVLAAWARILHARARLATHAEQRAIRRTGGPRADGRPLCITRHRSGAAEACLHLAAAAYLGGVWRDRHRARPVPAQRRHHDDRGAVAGRAGRVARRPADGRPVRRRDPACGRTGRLDHAATSMPTWRAQSRPLRTSTHWRVCAPNCGRASPPRRCATPPDWRASSRRRIAALWRRWCVDDQRDVRQLYAAGDADGACGLAERLLASDPCDAPALHVLGLIKFNQGDAATATALLRRSIDVTADAAVLSDLGVMLRSARTPRRKPKQPTAEALQLDPTLVQALGNLGNVLLDQHRADEAEAVLAEALRHAPDQPWLLRSLALSQMACGAPDRAEATLRQALAIDPDGRRSARYAWRIARPDGPSDRGGGASSRRPAAGAAAPSRALQPRHRIADAGQARRSRALLPRGAGRAAGLCRRARQICCSRSITAST